MPDEKKQPLGEKKLKERIFVYGALAVLILVIAYLGLRHTKRQISSLEKAPSASVQKEPFGPEEVAKIPIPQEGASEPSPPTPSAAKGEEPCEMVQNAMKEVLDYIRGSKPYKEAYGEKDPVEFINALTQKLSAKLPYEGGDQALSYTNQFHLFRRLGAKDIRLILRVLEDDPVSTEILFKSFYLWLISEKCDTENLKRPKEEVAIAYARFFLNTEAGANYLERRRDTTKFLTRYYLLLVLTRSETTTSHKMKDHYNFLKGYFDLKGDQLYLREEYQKGLEEIRQRLK